MLTILLFPLKILLIGLDFLVSGKVIIMVLSYR
jgi:hypothetical protein